MATAEKEITCPMCGFKNPESAERCRSCGAKVEEISASYSEDEARNRRYQQEHFEMKWALVAAGETGGAAEAPVWGSQQRADHGGVGGGGQGAVTEAGPEGGGEIGQGVAGAAAPVHVGAGLRGGRQDGLRGAERR